MSIFSELARHQRVYSAVNRRRRDLQSSIEAADARRESSGLTICTVNFRTTAFLTAAMETNRLLNSGDGHFREWLVIENTPEPELQLDPGLPGFKAIRSEHTHHFSSYGHSSGFNELLAFVKTRFALFIDPDCFMVRQHWIRDVLDHMDREGLAFFGTPTHPRVMHRFRYFPSPICMLVDFSRVPASTLDFTPPSSRWLEHMWFYWVLEGLRSLPSPLSSAGARLSVNQLHDVGFRIYDRYRNSTAVRHEVVQPVYSPPEPGRAGRLLNPILPDRLNTVPKREGYCVEEGFRETGWPDGRANGWEEFMWRNRPFAFHTRGITRDTTDREKVRRRTLEFLEDVAATVGTVTQP